jgi:methyl-accepting chemotaxis protein
LSRRAGDAISTILDLTQRSNVQMAQIARETGEQVEGSKSITAATQQVVGMGRAILEGTERQRAAAESVTARTGIMVRSLEAMARSLTQEADRSTRAAQDIMRVLQRAEAVRQESSRQRRAAVRIVSDVGDIDKVARAVLEGAEQIAQDAAGLRTRVEGLTRLVERFEVS